MTQRYKHPLALERMSHNLCPECGQPGAIHSTDNRFWMRFGCDLLPAGVEDRIAQYRADAEVNQ